MTVLQSLLLSVQAILAANGVFTVLIIIDIKNMSEYLVTAFYKSQRYDEVT